MNYDTMWDEPAPEKAPAVASVGRSGGAGAGDGGGGGGGGGAEADSGGRAKRKPKKSIRVEEEEVVDVDEEPNSAHESAPDCAQEGKFAERQKLGEANCFGCHKDIAQSEPDPVYRSCKCQTCNRVWCVRCARKHLKLPHTAPFLQRPPPPVMPPVCPTPWWVGGLGGGGAHFVFFLLAGLSMSSIVFSFVLFVPRCPCSRDSLTLLPSSFQRSWET